MAFKIIATEGSTTDGRDIPREWIEQMAATYDPKVYGARISLEHIRGIDPDGLFKAFGDIKALKTAENADGKLQLFGDIDPTDELRAMVKKRQKVYTSIEVEPNFAKTGKAYLTGLGVTDTPASLGTEMLQFSAKMGAESPFASRKHNADNVFSAAVEILGDLDTADHRFSDDSEGEQDNGPTLREKLAAIFKKQDTKAAAGDNALRAEVEESLNLFADRHGALADQITGLPSKTEFAELTAKIDQMYAALDAQPDTPPRTPATGGDGGTVQADC